MNIKQARTIFCLGIGGIGVSGLARLFLSMDKNVSGSDLKESEITKSLEKLGIKVSIGKNIVEGNPDLVIYSPAVPDQDLVKVKGAKLSQAQVLGDLMDDYYGIGVTGTNGKSTTSAMLGLILEQAELDPTVLIGSLLSPKNESKKFKGNARLGEGQHLVIESDEFKRKMLENKPQMIVMTNIAEDHLDYYKSLADIKSAFLEYAKSLPKEGILIFNADDHNSIEVGKHAESHKFTFGVHHYADLQALNVKLESGKTIFDLHLNDVMIGTVSLKVPGVFNISNALAATLAALKLNVKFENIKKALESFVGTWRRFEIVGDLNGKTVISDYAHHPAGISATLLAAKQFYPDKKILIVFQPHQRNRTKTLFGEFVDSLAGSDDVIIPEIFDVAGREQGEDISSKQLVEELKKQEVRAIFTKDLEATEKLIKEKAKDFDVILIMGAGDIDLVARKLIV